MWKKGHKETKCKSGTKAASKNKAAAKKSRPAKSLSVVSSTYETDSINRRQYVTLMKNGRKVRMQLDTASDVTLISRKTCEILGSPAVRPANHITRNASGDVLKLEGELECQVCLGDRQIQTRCFLTEQSGYDLLGLDWLDALGLLKQIFNTIVEDQMPTPVTNLTERAEMKSAPGRNRQKDQPETITGIEARTKADSCPNDTKTDIIQVDVRK